MKKTFNLSDFLRDENKIKFKLDNQKRNLSADNPTTSAYLDVHDPVSKKQHFINEFFDSDLSDEDASNDEEDEADDVFLCFLYKNGKLGCSSYVI